jgi:hypothetical protein
MRQVLTLFTLGLLGCPSHLEQTCARVAVDVTGAIGPTGGFGGAGGGNVGLPTPLGVVGSPLELPFFAPLSACVSDTLRVRAEVLGPDNLPVELDVAFTPPHLTAAGPVQTRMTFTPTQPGLYIVRAIFEPSLGVRTTEVLVAESRLTPPTTRVPVVDLASCVDGVWPLAADAVVCERASGTIEVHRADGSAEVFTGEQLVVVDSVLWSVDSSTSTLSRREYRDGGLRVLDTFPDIDSRPLPSLHDTDVALRAGLDHQLHIAHAGGTTVTLFIDVRSLSSQVLWVDGSLLFSAGGGCPMAPCVNDLRGLDGEVVWQGDFSSPGLISALRRPALAIDDAPPFRLRVQTESRALPIRGFDVLPLWVPSTDSISVLVWSAGPSLSLSAWHRAEVLRVGRRFVVLKDSNSSVLLAPR